MNGKRTLHCAALKADETSTDHAVRDARATAVWRLLYVNVAHSVVYISGSSAAENYALSAHPYTHPHSAYQTFVSQLNDQVLSARVTGQKIRTRFQLL